jgi:hypothetical protein
VEGPPAEQLDRTARALRYVLWFADNGERLAAGEHPADVPPCPVAEEDLPGLVAPLAALVIAARRALAENLGKETPQEQAEWASGQLLAEAEGLEMAASFAVIAAELGA